MEVTVNLSTTLEFDSLEDFEDAVNIVMCDMSPDEIIELANNQGNPIKVDVN